MKGLREASREEMTVTFLSFLKKKSCGSQLLYVDVIISILLQGEIYAV